MLLEQCLAQDQYSANSSCYQIMFDPVILCCLHMLVVSFSKQFSPYAAQKVSSCESDFSRLNLYAPQ